LDLEEPIVGQDLDGDHVQGGVLLCVMDGEHALVARTGGGKAALRRRKPAKKKMTTKEENKDEG